MSQAQRISRDDIETKLREIDSGFRQQVVDKKKTILTGIAVGSAVILLVMFLLGKRSGKKKTTIVEIRRV
ncbi:MAG TPA: hypothetical protein VG478_09655 [Acidimicrobiales bacterium]|nr:hypothetical protein [Acidimicrobiales bacterium]